MSAQVADRIIVNNKMYSLLTHPLEQYWEKYDNKPVLLSFNTGNVRGYWAKWIIEDERLFLIDFSGETLLDKKFIKYSMQDIFPDSNKLFADWYNGRLCIGVGEKMDSSNLEKYQVIMKVQNGVVIDSNIIDTV